MGVYALGETTPDLADYCWVAPNAAVIGKVTLAKAASVWFGAVLRGDTELISIGQRSNVQDNAVLHTDAGYPLAIHDDCTIGHGAILHGCEIGAGSLVGMGAIILNGARIGKDCLIGANSVVTGKLVVPDGSLLLGSPAKVVRPLGADELGVLAAAATFYVQNALRFSTSLSLMPPVQRFDPA